jgi:hypothetical protein
MDLEDHRNDTIDTHIYTVDRYNVQTLVPLTHVRSLWQITQEQFVRERVPR